jgi:hypothetical protein
MLKLVIDLITPGPLKERFPFSKRVWISWINLSLAQVLVVGIVGLALGAIDPSQIFVSLFLSPLKSCLFGLLGMWLNSFRGADPEQKGWFWMLLPFFSQLGIGLGLTVIFIIFILILFFPDVLKTTKADLDRKERSDEEYRKKQRTIAEENRRWEEEEDLRRKEEEQKRREVEERKKQKQEEEEEEERKRKEEEERKRKEEEKQKRERRKYAAEKLDQLISQWQRECFLVDILTDEEILIFLDQEAFPITFIQEITDLEKLFSLENKCIERNATYYLKCSGQPLEIRIYESKNDAKSNRGDKFLFTSSISSKRELVLSILDLVTPARRIGYLENAILSVTYSCAGEEESEDYELHHIIPMSLAERNPLVISAIKYGLFDKNGSRNTIYLSTLVHSVDHLEYTRRVEQDLNRCVSILEGDFLDDEVMVKKAIDTVLNQWRDYCKLKNKKQDAL